MDKDIAPVISVIMPVYNCSEFVGEAIESILRQTFTDFELIIIDDKSTDNTRQVIESYIDPRIKVIRNSYNTGYTVNLNQGIDVANGKYIARMDGDDISYPTRFEKQVNYLEANPEVILCGTWYISNSTIIKKPENNDDIKIALLEDSAIGHPTVMFRKRFFNEHKLRYNSDFEPAEDYELWTRLIFIGRLANIPEVLLCYRIHPNQISIKKDLLQKNNADICRKRMLFQLIPRITQKDTDGSLLFFSNIDKNSINSLNSLVSWINKLIHLNSNKRVYHPQKFYSFLAHKRKVIIRDFYITRNSFRPNLFLSFLLLGSTSRQSLDLNEQVKLFIKCILFWKKN